MKDDFLYLEVDIHSRGNGARVEMIVLEG